MKKKILVVDDTRLMRNIIKDSINQSGEYHIFEAENGCDAVNMYKEIKPDLVTMDITMEEMNGVDAAKTILSDDPKARIIMITSLGQNKILYDCIEETSHHPLPLSREGPVRMSLYLPNNPDTKYNLGSLLLVMIFSTCVNFAHSS